EAHPAVLDPVGEQLAHSLGVLALAADPVEPGLELDRLVEVLHLFDLEPGGIEHLAPLLLGVIAHVRRIANPVGLLGLVTHEQVVDDEHEVAADAGHLVRGCGRVVEVMVRHARGDDVEAALGERQMLGARDHVGEHPRRGVGRHDLDALLPEPPRDVAATGGDVERGSRAAGPFDEQVEVRALLVRRALSVELGALAPDVAHFASSTDLRAASSIVGSTKRFGGAASCSSRRPSSAFVPSRRTTIGCWIVMRSSAVRIPRATSSQRVIPPKMLKKIDFTCGSAVITSSASTTPSASPPPPRSQKFAGCPPARAITSSVDMTRPAPLPRIPTSPSSFT